MSPIGKRIAISSPAFTATPIKDMLDSISGKFSVWEITSEYKHSLPDAAKELKELLPSYDVKLQAHAPFSDINIAGFNSNIRRTSVKAVEDVIKASRKLDIELITVHPGFYSPITFVDKEHAKKLNIESIVELGKISKELGIKIALENMPSIQWVILETASEMRAALDAADIGMCFDIGHANTTGRIDEMLGLNKSFINVHTHDNKGDRDSHLALGDGNVDFRKVFSKLNGYKGNYVLEMRSLEDGVKSKAKLERLMAD